MLQDQLKIILIEAVKKLYNHDLAEIELDHPEVTGFGDLSTNLALKLAKTLKQNPLDIAKKLAYELEKTDLYFTFANKKIKSVASINIAPPGFINITFSTEWLKYVLFIIQQYGNTYGSNDILKNKHVVIEYTDPNPFKVFHIGHLMTNAIGESLSNIYEFSGAEVKRVNYQGDVGIHVAKSVWGILKKMTEEHINMEQLEQMTLIEKVEFMGNAYAYGSKMSEADEQVKQEIIELNKLIYFIAQESLVIPEIHTTMVDYKKYTMQAREIYDYEVVKSIYIKGRAWSLAYFETLYELLGSKFDFYFFESLVAEYGYKLVQENLDNGVFVHNQGATIFEGDKLGLHTRVFINSLGIPVYEAKDLGLAFLKYQKYSYDKSIIVTANEINEYFKVVLAAMNLINPELAQKTIHIGHGMMRFKEGKMSSRTGNVIAGDKLLTEIKSMIRDKMASTGINIEDDKKEDTINKIAVSALKYSILKSGIGNDIIYNQEESINITGNTGPYLLYTYARTQSILAKVKKPEMLADLQKLFARDLNRFELDILRHIYKFPEVVSLASTRLSPNLIAGFAYDLAQKYNTFYAEIPILNASDDDQQFRVLLTQCVAQVISNSMHLLGIAIVDKM